MPKTLFDKLWDSHVVTTLDDGQSLLYIDLHLVHEVTSPQAFEGLRLGNRQVRQPLQTFATMDHNVPTVRPFEIHDAIAKKQIDTLADNCAAFGIPLADLHSAEQGIVHVIGPELALTLPGKTIVCGDSHTSTHGAFGALAFGIGTSEVEHVLATQCLWQHKPRTMKIELSGVLNPGVTSKDVILGLLGRYGIDFGTGYVIEFTGDAVNAMSMEARMTVCNMAIEAGARAGLIAPDETTVRYLEGRAFAPTGAAWMECLEAWADLKSDPDAQFDKVLQLDVSQLRPQVTWGTNPGMCIGVHDVIPNPEEMEDSTARDAARRALEYMGLEPGTQVMDIPIQYVFIGSCTNARLEDLRLAATIVDGYSVADGVTAMVVPGSKQVKTQAEAEGLDQIFRNAGFEWREPGCSMCLGMNPDVLPEKSRSASTSNRNFEGRQGRGARTHLVSPAMAAAAAIAGHFVDVTAWDIQAKRRNHGGATHPA